MTDTKLNIAKALGLILIFIMAIIHLKTGQHAITDRLGAFVAIIWTLSLPITARILSKDTPALVFAYAVSLICYVMMIMIMSILAPSDNLRMLLIPFSLGLYTYATILILRWLTPLMERLSGNRGKAHAPTAATGQPDTGADTEEMTENKTEEKTEADSQDHK